ncbi:MAG: MFS transporter [Candidatus Kapaibacterium sp.]
MKTSKERMGWYFYDWANSSYPLVISTAIFPLYYSAVTHSATSGDYVRFLGISFYNSALYSYAVALSFLLVSMITPVLSGIADYSGRKKRFLNIFCTSGSLACASLALFRADALGTGLLSVMIASMGFSGSLVFYNAFLPEIASQSEQDMVSARGFAMGYIGSSLLLIFDIAVISKPALFGIDTHGMNETQVFLMIAPWTFVLVGLWWRGWAQLTLNWLKERPGKPLEGSPLTAGFRELRGVLASLMHQDRLKRFLTAFFSHSMGVQTVILVSTFFGKQVIGMRSDQMLGVLLLLQFVAIGGSYLFAALSSRIGNIRALCTALALWIAICVSAYFITTATEFTVLSMLVGIVLGGTQSLSRSTYSKMLPETHDHASFFSFYDICEKLGVVVGMFAFGWISDVTGSMRNASVALTVFFAMSLGLLLTIDRRTTQERPAR